MSVWYLDIDDEITDAVARLRAATDEQVVLVVPPGSRIATGRINFRLLAREAGARDRVLAIASPDAQVRALAMSAGLPAHPTAAEAEAALARGETSPPEVPVPEPGSAGEGEGGDEPGAVERVAPMLILPATHEMEEAGGRSMSRRARVGVLLGVVAGLAALGGVAAVTVLPTASITLRPLVRTVGPVVVAVVADPEAEEADEAAGVVPAQRLDIPLSVAGSFEASGRKTIESHASGEVVFSWEAPLFELDIVAGTRVQTPEGVEFDTVELVRMPVPASGPAQVSARVRAVEAGPEGNVPAAAISIVPALEGIRVSNAEPTSGGAREETPVITPGDYQRAAETLKGRLEGQLEEHLGDASAWPAGVTIFSDSQLGEVRTLPSPDELVGQPLATFDLSAKASATALAVDETLVAGLAAERLARETPQELALIPATVRTEAGPGDPQTDGIHYAATAEGQAAARIDEPELLEQLTGVPVPDARAILDAYGTSQVTVWPDFVGSLPDDPDRIDLRVVDPEVGSE